MLQLNQRYVVDDDGRRVAVMLEIEEYQLLLDELEALRLVRSSSVSGGHSGGQGSLPSDEAADLGIVHHPRASDASPERLREAIGVLSLKGPVEPRSWRLFEEGEIGGRPSDCDARH